MAFFVDLAPGDTLVVGHGTRIVMESKTGQRARLRVDSDQDVERVKAGEIMPTRAAPADTAPLRTPPEQRAVPQPFLKRRTTA